jgi:hypothetical protein
VAPLSIGQVLVTARIKAPGVYIQEHDESHHEHEADDRKPPVPGRRQVGEFEPSLQTPPSVPAQGGQPPSPPGSPGARRSWPLRPSSPVGGLGFASTAARSGDRRSCSGRSSLATDQEPSRSSRATKRCVRRSESSACSRRARSSASPRVTKREYIHSGSWPAARVPRGATRRRQLRRPARELAGGGSEGGAEPAEPSDRRKRLVPACELTGRRAAPRLEACDIDAEAPPCEHAVAGVRDDQPASADQVAGEAAEQYSAPDARQIGVDAFVYAPGHVATA